MIHSVKRKYPVGSNPGFLKAGHVRWVTSCVLALVVVLVLLLVGHSFGAKWPDPPSRQPAQMASRVDYDPKLTDPFFESNEWSYPWYIIKHPDGHFEDTSTGIPPKKEPPHLKHTAECFITALGYARDKDLVSFCKARLLGVNKIDLRIHDLNPTDIDELRVQIRNGMFTSQYWTYYKWERGHLIWTMKRQGLTLDKKTYRKGDVIKGRIDFECVEEEITDLKGVETSDRKPRNIKIYGVFKTIVE